jgi:Arc/MetJ-type ribon-helix-helix transcriptional regulator
MTTISVPVKAEEAKFVDDYIKSGQAENKAQVFRRALRLLREEEVLARVRKSEEDFKQGRIFEGDIRKILKKF